MHILIKYCLCGDTNVEHNKIPLGRSKHSKNAKCSKCACMNFTERDEYREEWE